MFWLTHGKRYVPRPQLMLGISMSLWLLASWPVIPQVPSVIDVPPPSKPLPSPPPVLLSPREPAPQLNVSPSSSQPIEQLQQADFLYRQRRWVEAIASYSQIIRTHPRFIPAYIGLGSALNDSDRPQEAIAAFNQALQIRPNPYAALVHYNLGVTYYRQRNLDRAIAAFRQTLALDRNFTRAAISLAYALDDQGEYRDAQRAYEVAVRLDPQNSDLYYRLAMVLGRLNRLQEAQNLLQRARDLYTAQGNQTGAQRVNFLLQRL